MSESIYILSAMRTPVGSPFRGFKDLTAAQLGAVVVSAVVQRAKIKKTDVDEVILGNTVSAGAGQNVARQAAVMAGLPVKVPAYTVNNVCGAGLQAVFSAVQAIEAGRAELVLAGGTESASQCPLLLPQEAKENFQEELLQDSLLVDGLWCHLSGKRMGELAEYLAGKARISRADQDRFSLQSHQRAVEAQAKGLFDREIVPVKTGSGTISSDERPRKNLKLAGFEALPAAFVKDGTVTAGNSSVPSDGASAVALASEGFVRKNKLSPAAKVLACVSVAVDPVEVFTATVPAVQAVLRQAGLAAKDIDVWEVGEAFAVQVLYAQNKLKIPAEKVNIYGGDIALGHPLGAAGARILTTLTSALLNEHKRRGLACICLGGGGCLAIVIEKTK